jgi:hypothetical protein
VQIESLLTSLREELALSKENRDTGASDLSLQTVINLLRRAETSAASGQAENAKEALSAAARQVGDSWSFSSTLGIAVLEFVQATKRTML